VRYVGSPVGAHSERDSALASRVSAAARVPALRVVDHATARDNAYPGLITALLGRITEGGKPDGVVHRIHRSFS
jgi:hypothetical protein